MGGRLIDVGVCSAVLAVTMTSGIAAAETHKELRFNVAPKAALSVNNPYGSVSIKPTTGNVVVVNAVLSSDKVEVDNNFAGNRVDLQSHLLAGADAQSGRRSIVVRTFATRPSAAEGPPRPEEPRGGRAGPGKADRKSVV